MEKTKPIGNQGEKQLRGEEIRQAIRLGILDLASEAGPGYIFSALKLAGYIGVSRTTIYAYRDVVDETLKEVSGRRAMAKGEGALQVMREKVERLEREKKTLMAEIQALQDHHVEIYRKLYLESAQLAALVRPQLEMRSFEKRQCILCKQPIEQCTLPEPEPSRVLRFPASKKKK